MPKNDTNSARDTHFQGFAQMLTDALSNVVEFDFPGSRELATRIIAQRAYDFAWHVIGCVGGGFETNQYLNDEDILRDLEDMTQWPRRENADETQQSKT